MDFNVAEKATNGVSIAMTDPIPLDTYKNRFEFLTWNILRKENLVFRSVVIVDDCKCGFWNFKAGTIGCVGSKVFDSLAIYNVLIELPILVKISPDHVVAVGIPWENLALLPEETPLPTDLQHIKENMIQQVDGKTNVAEVQVSSFSPPEELKDLYSEYYGTFSKRALSIIYSNNTGDEKIRNLGALVYDIARLLKIEHKEIQNPKETAERLVSAFVDGVVRIYKGDP